MAYLVNSVLIYVPHWKLLTIYTYIYTVKRGRQICRVEATATLVQLGQMFIQRCPNANCPSG